MGFQVGEFSGSCRPSTTRATSQGRRASRRIGSRYGPIIIPIMTNAQLVNVCDKMSFCEAAIWKAICCSECTRWEHCRVRSGFYWASACLPTSNTLGMMPFQTLPALDKQTLWLLRPCIYNCICIFWNSTRAWQTNNIIPSFTSLLLSSLHNL